MQQAEIQHEETVLAAVPKKEEIEAQEEGEEPPDSGIENASDSGSEHEAASVDILEDAVGWNVSNSLLFSSRSRHVYPVKTDSNLKNFQFLLS